MAVDIHTFQPGESWEQARVYLNSSLASIVAELLLKAAATDVYTKTQIDASITTLNNSINLKANTTDVYTKTQVDSALLAKANDSATVHKTTDETIDWIKSFSKTVYSAWWNTTNGLWLAANWSDHVFFWWFVNLVRKAYMWFAWAWLTTLTINNEMTNGDINFVTNGTGKVKVNWTEIWTWWGWTGTAKICYEGYLPWVQVVWSTWVNVSGQVIPTASKFKICLSILPTGANFICELRKNWTAIGTATIATTASATNGMYITDATTSAAIAENDKLEVYITQVWSTVSGSNFSFQLVSA